MPDEVIPLRKTKARVVARTPKPPPGDVVRAYELTRSGASWIEVAAQTGYPDAVAASLAVTVYLSRMAVARVDEERAAKLELEVARLDYLQLKWWRAATEGTPVYDEAGAPVPESAVLDDKAASVVLKVIALRSKLLGLDVPSEQAVKVQTIVISGSSEEYIAGLKALED